MPPFIGKWVNTDNVPDWKATCEVMNKRNAEREQWFIKWFGEYKVI
jgi:hypothetical protein